MNLRAIQTQNDGLLLQFILHEFLQSVSAFEEKKFEALAPSQFMPAYFQTRGSLEKLKAYLSVFPRDVSQLQEVIDVALNAVQAKDEASLTTQLQRARDLLLDDIVSFRENENVLLFLLRHQVEIDHVYQAPMVRKTFEILFPEGLDAARLFLEKRYETRGFYHLVPLIAQKLERLAS